ncbi:DUF2750 domain-containing protein [Actinoplanes sp. NPDC023936]|uniref:DUF2750 domain-containing protein n=1 Tax=Actinoplanes sp. NPDC023936 TaxID=3154910 RepID=UPI0033DB3E80
MAPDDISRAEADRLRRLDGPARAAHTFDVLADRGVLWVWGDEDEVLFTEDAKRRTMLPIWPHAAVARLEHDGEVDGERPMKIPVKVFLTEWLPQLAEDDADISVFPVEERGAAVLTVEEFRARMR